MRESLGATGRCECGEPLIFAERGVPGDNQELACRCGRRHDCRFGESGWVALAQLEPERSVPLSGFSNELRHAPDAERFRFPFPLRGQVPLPVHILFSPEKRAAELRAADLKMYRIDDVDSVTQARRLWIDWWQRMQGAPRRRGPSPMVPSRVGRLPVSLAKRPRPAPLPAH